MIVLSRKKLYGDMYFLTAFVLVCVDAMSSA